MLVTIMLFGLAIVLVAILLPKSKDRLDRMSAIKADKSMLPEQFVVFDLETTGLDADRHEIIEIGAIKVNRDSDEHQTFTVLVMPKGRISSRITELTGIDRKMIKSGGTDIDTALSEFRLFVGDVPLVAYNVRFDRAFLQAACVRANQPEFGNRFHCALKLARKAWPGRDSYKLTEISRDAGLSTVSSHRALPDCERAAHIFVSAAQNVGHI